MDHSHKRACVALALAGLIRAAFADESAPSGRDVFERHCRTCHGGTAPSDSPIGPSLTGIVGARSGTQASGMHPLGVIDFGITWDRESLRRFLAKPRREIPGTLMPVGIVDSRELESLPDFLRSLH